MNIQQKLSNLSQQGLVLSLMFFGALLQRWRPDNDLWFILNGGRYVMEQGIPHTEPFTVHAGLHFVLEQWLTGVIFWQIYNILGETGLLELIFFLGCALIYAYYRLCLLLSEENRQVSFMMALTVGIMTAPVFFVTRPQVISLFIFVMEIFFLEKYLRTSKKSYLLVLPLASVLIVNLHAALWPFVFVLLAPFVLDWLMGKFGLISFHFPGSKFSVRPLAVAALAAFLAGFINPYGWEAMTFVLYSYDPVIHGRIAEIQAVNAGIREGKYFFALTALLIALQARNSVPLRYFLLFLGTMLMGLFFIRNMFLFFFLGTLPLAYIFRGWHSKFLARNTRTSPVFVVPFLAIALMAVLLFLSRPELHNLTYPWIVELFFLFALPCGIISLWSCSKEGKGFDLHWPSTQLKVMSVSLVVLSFYCFSNWYGACRKDETNHTFAPAIDYLLAMHRPEEITLWTGFNSGAYPEFRRIKCYMDARPEVFLPSNTGIEHNIIKEYFDLADEKLDYKEFFRENHFDYAMTVPGDGAIYTLLPHDEDFLLVYEQKNAEGEVMCRIFKVNL